MADALKLTPSESVEIRRCTGSRTERWFRAIDRLHREGRVGRNGMPGPLAFGVMLTEYHDVFRLDAKLQFLVRGALRGMAVLGRLRGYSPHPD